jgi:hypothetical protein
MLRFVKITTILLAVLMLAQPVLAAQRFIRGGPAVVVVRPGFGFGPGWYGGYGYGWYGPWGPAYLVPRSNTGEVKIVTHLKTAQVYVDGGYAGVAGKLKHFGLSPGTHDIEVRDSSGRSLYHQRIQVLFDKTAEIRVD